MQKKVIKQVCNDKEIVGEFYFTKFIESGGKKEYNKYIVNIFNPYKSLGGFSLSRSYCFKRFDNEEEAIEFFNKEFKKITRRESKPKKTRVIDERYNYDEIKKERGSK